MCKVPVLPVPVRTRATPLVFVVKKLSAPVVLVVNSSTAESTALVCIVFMVLARARKVPATVVVTSAFPMLISVAVEVPILRAANVSNEGAAIPIANAFVPVQVLLLDSRVVPAFSVD